MTYSNTLVVFALALVGQAATMPVSGLVEARLGPRLTALLGVWTMAGGVALSSMAQSLTFFMVTYGLLFGFGIGMA